MAIDMRHLVVVFVLALVLLAPISVSAIDCAHSTTGNVPLADLGSGTYHGFAGGLYPGGSNAPPLAYQQAGVAAGQAIQPRNGKSVLLSIGMSNSQVFWQDFVPLAKANPNINPAVVMVDGTQPTYNAIAWADPKKSVWRTVKDRLAAQGFTESDVQAVWLMEAVGGGQDIAPFPSGARTLTGYLAKIVQNAESKYVNLKQVHVASLQYMGYASDQNPIVEPEIGYENGWSEKWLIEDRVTGKTTGRAWVGWNAELWADGTTPRSDGLTWACSDFASDGIHPVNGGSKGAQRMLNAYLTAPETGWFRR